MAVAVSTCSTPSSRCRPEECPTASSRSTAGAGSSSPHSAVSAPASSGAAQPASALCSMPTETAVVRRVVSAARVARRHRREAGVPHRPGRDQRARQHVVAGGGEARPAPEQVAGDQVVVAAVEPRRPPRRVRGRQPGRTVGGPPARHGGPERTGRRCGKRGHDQAVRQPDRRRRGHADHRDDAVVGLVVHAHRRPGGLAPAPDRLVEEVRHEGRRGAGEHVPRLLAAPASGALRHTFRGR